MTMQEIHKICLKYNIKNYTINDDLSIDVDGNVLLFNSGLLRIPLKFRKVTGIFTCHWNRLKSLEGSPSYVGGKFDCSANQLKSLKGAPSYVGGEFICCNKSLTSLEGAPNIVGGEFRCTYTPLESLSGITIGIKKENLKINAGYNYIDYIAYCRDIKFKKLLK